MLMFFSWVKTGLTNGFGTIKHGPDAEKMVNGQCPNQDFRRPGPKTEVRSMSKWSFGEEFLRQQRRISLHPVLQKKCLMPP